jgi:hypothetical protein
MSQNSAINMNIKQNAADFELEPISEQPPFFRFKYLSKTLDKTKEKPEKIENYRTIIIKYLIKSCT